TEFAEIVFLLSVERTESKKTQPASLSLSSVKNSQDVIPRNRRIKIIFTSSIQYAKRSVSFPLLLRASRPGGASQQQGKKMISLRPLRLRGELLLLPRTKDSVV
ncbi:MAG: hypothetical protein V1930_05000, partial [Pseudomonadota bacterium]